MDEQEISRHIFEADDDDKGTGLEKLDLYEKRIQFYRDEGRLTQAQYERLREDVAKRADCLIGPVTFTSDREECDGLETKRSGGSRVAKERQG